MTEHRAVFDAAITFSNGGDLQTRGFRLDVPGPDVTPDDVAQLLVRHLGLLMVDTVVLDPFTIVEEPHRGSRGVEAAAPQARLIELSRVIRAGLVTYPGLPAPTISAHVSREQSRGIYAPGTEFEIGHISMVGNTGTYLDSPYHRYADGHDLSGVALESVADVPICIVRLDGGARGTGAAALAHVDVAGKAVLLHTGWDKHWDTPHYGDPAPFLNAEGAQFLADHGAALVGIDSVNIDDTASGGERPAHTILLGAKIPVLEHLTNLAAVPVSGARLHAAPPLIEGFGTFPVRAYAIVG